MGAFGRIADAVESLAHSAKWYVEYLERLEKARKNAQEYEMARRRVERGVSMTGDHELVGNGAERPVERSDPRRDPGGEFGRERRNETGGTRIERAADGARKSGYPSRRGQDWEGQTGVDIENFPEGPVGVERPRRRRPDPRYDGGDFGPIS